MVGATDLKIYKSASGGLGGAIDTAAQVISANPNNFFTNIPKNELTLGEDFFGCVYWKNTHATESMDNFKVWLGSKTLPPDTELKWSLDSNPSSVQTIADKYTSPIGVSWNSLEPEPAATNIGNLAAGSSFPMWLWLHVNANAVARLDDGGVFSFNFQIPQGGTGTGGSGGGTGGTGGGTGGNPPPANTDFKVAVAGDWGCENATDDVLALINSQAYDFVVGVGDNAYASASCWTSKFKALKDSGKFDSGYGNHEYEESGGIAPYKTFFGHNLTYFTHKFQNILFLFIDSNINMDPGSAQHNFILNALQQAANDNTITWKVGIIHHPWFGSSSQHTYNSGSSVQAFHQLFIDNKVSIVCTGHNHNFQRTFQVSYNAGSPTNPTVVDNTSPYAKTTAVLIHVITGTGGHDSGSSLYSLGSQPSFQAYQNRTHNGVWEMVASNNAQTLTCQFRDINGDVFDTFTITAT